MLCRSGDKKYSVTMTTVGVCTRATRAIMRLEGRESAPVKIIFDLGYSCDSCAQVLASLPSLASAQKKIGRTLGEPHSSHTV